MKKAGIICFKVFTYIMVALMAAAFTLKFCRISMENNQSKLDQMENLIQERFIGEADRTQMEDAAAQAMVKSLGDQWSYYIPASQYQAHMEQMNNAYVGIGVTIELMEDGSGFRVIKVEQDGPADVGGMLPDDVIVAIDGQNVAGLSTGEARELVRGEEGTQVAVTVRRDGGSPMELTLTRKALQTQVAAGEMLDGQIGLVTIANFDARCANETISVIEDLLAQGAEALVFDVRYNPGGYKNELVKVLDYLLPEGPLFRSLDYRGREAVDQSDEKCLDIPMAVLVNGESYSAAEFFAAALREYEAATVVGEPTVGKGYFQETYRLKDGSAIGLSVGKYSTPKGISLAEEGGLVPDVLVEVDEETAKGIYTGTLEAKDDPQIQSAVDALKAA